MLLLTRWVLAMAAIAGGWLIAGAMLCALGGVVARAAGLRGWDADRAFARFWVGLALVLALVQAVHLVVPLDGAVSLTLAALGIAAVAAVSREWRVAWRSCRLSLPWAFVAAILLAWLANRAIGLPDVYDTRMYHINAVRWANEYAVVPGIAHIQRALAFNNSSHLVAACLDNGVLDGVSHHVTNGIFLVALAARSLLGLSRLAGGAGAGNDAAGRGIPVAEAYYGLMLLPVVALAVRPEICSLSSDLPAGVLVIVMGGELLAWLASGDARGRWGDRLLLLACLPPLAISVKLSVAATAVTGSVTVLAALLLLRVRFRLVAGVVAAMAAAAAALLVPWAARGVMMSGYPAFPLRVAGVPVEWRVSDTTLRWSQEWIRAHARGAPTRTGIEPWLETWDWLGPWLIGLAAEEFDRLLIPAVLAVLGVSMLTVARRSRPLLLTAAVPALVGGAVWFLEAPAYRMGFGFVWAIAGVTLATAVAALAAEEKPGSRRVRRPAAAVAVLGLLPLAAVAQGLVTSARQSSGERSLGQLLWPVVYPPAKAGWFHEFEPGGYRESTNRWGTRYYVGDMNDFVWYVPLPAVPSERPDVRERDPGNPGGGYVHDTSPVPVR